MDNLYVLFKIDGTHSIPLRAFRSQKRAENAADNADPQSIHQVEELEFDPAYIEGEVQAHTITVCDPCFHGKHNECADLTSNIYDCGCNCPRGMTPVACSLSGETIAALKKLDNRVGALERMPHNQWKPDTQPNPFCSNVGCDVIGSHGHPVGGPAQTEPAKRT